MKFRDPLAMRRWYEEVLGLAVNDYGVLFEFGGEQTKKAYLQLGTFEHSSDYFGSDSQQYMINFRVDNLIELEKELRQKKVVIVDQIDEYEYGKFLHIEDPEGNRIELWEAVDSEFSGNEKSIQPMR